MDRSPFPHSVRTVIDTRVSRLGEGATKVLSTASVIGRDFDLDLLAETTKVDEDELIDLLEEAQRAAVVHELPDSPGRYTFSHALVQHTLYEGLGATRRTRVHLSVGEAIERLFGAESDERVGELARHFFLATKPTDTDKAISYARRAGEAALVALAPDDAVRYFSQALELVGDGANVEPSDRIDLLTCLGTAQRQAGIPAFRETLLEAARRGRAVGDTRRLVAAVLANSRGWFTSLGQVDTEKMEMIEAALSSHGTGDSPERARLLATLCSELNYGSQLERRLALADEAKTMARRLGDAATLIEVVIRCAAAVQAPSTLEDCLADITEALAVARDLDDPSVLFRLAHRGYALAVSSGQFDLAHEYLTITQALAKKLCLPTFVWSVAYVAAAEALLHGDSAKGEELAAAALDSGAASGQPDAFGYYGAQLMTARFQQGRYGEVVPLIADAADRNPAIPSYKAALAAANLDGGNEVAARDLIDEAAALSFSVPEDFSWFTAIVSYARVAVELRLREHAETLFRMLAPFEDNVPHNGLNPQEPVATHLGGLATVLGRFEEAEGYFAQAAQLNTRGQMRFAEAQTSMLWGRMLGTRNGPGDADRARVLLEQARAIAATNDYAMVERRATEELSKLD